MQWTQRQFLLISAAVLVLASVVVFGPFMGNAFLSLDDGLLIYSNPAVTRITPETVKYIFTSYDPELYIPLTLFSYQLNYIISGFEPTLYHVTNLTLHVGSAILVLWIILQLTGSRIAAFVAALFFAIHPLQTEAVLWAAARKDVLSGFFFFLSFSLFLRYEEDRSHPHYWWSLVCFAFALLAKVSVVTLPFVFLLLRWTRRIPLRRSVQDLVPFGGLSVLFLIIAVIGKAQMLESSGLWLNMLMAAKSTAFYLWKLLWPTNLSVIYPQAAPVSIAMPDILGSLLVTAALVVLSLVLLLRRHALHYAFGIGFFLILLLPNYTNFLKNGFLFFGSDRYAYLASIGMFLIAGLLVDRAVHLLRMRGSGVILALIPVMAVAALFSWRTVVQGRTWRNSESLYRQVLAAYPESAIGHNNLGDVLLKEGRADEALPHFEEALRIDPSMMIAHINIGRVHEERGKLEDAHAEYRQAIEAVQQEEILGLDAIVGYYYLGGLYEKMGRVDDSLEQFRMATERSGARVAEPFYNYGIMLQKAGKADEAIVQLERAIALEPLHKQAHYHLAGILAERGMLDEAIRELLIVVRLDPFFAKAQEHLRNLKNLRGNGLQ